VASVQKQALLQKCFNLDKYVDIQAISCSNVQTVLVYIKCVFYENISALDMIMWLSQWCHIW